MPVDAGCAGEDVATGIGASNRRCTVGDISPTPCLVGALAATGAGAADVVRCTVVSGKPGPPPSPSGIVSKVRCTESSPARPGTDAEPDQDGSAASARWIEPAASSGTAVAVVAIGDRVDPGNEIDPGMGPVGTAR
jgi:hypothetical protein